MVDIVIAVLLVAAVVFLIRWRRGTPERTYFSNLARQAGYESDTLQPYYWAAKIVGAILLPLIAMNLKPSISPVVLLGLGILGFFAADLALVLRRNNRQRRILQALSFFLDLVVSFLRSGLSLEESLNRAAWRGLPPGHPLGDEVKLVGQEIAAGKEGSTAFLALARRSNLPDLQTIAAAMELGSRLGFPVAETLAVQADVQREKRAERGKKRIDRAMIVALFPVMLAGFPLFLIAVVYPTAMKILDTMKMIRSMFG